MNKLYLTMALWAMIFFGYPSYADEQKCVWEGDNATCGYHDADGDGHEELHITITIPRTASDLASATYSYDVLYSEEQAIDTVKGVDIIQNGPDGQSSSLFIRGTESDHSLITLNGIPIKDHSTPSGADDLSQHNLIGIDKVTVIKGPMSNTMGANAAGGVVDLQSDSYGDSYIDLSFGSNNYLSKEISITDKDYKDNHDFNLVVNQTTTDGISVYPEGTENDPLETNTYNFNYTYFDQGYHLKFLTIKDKNDANLDSGNADVLNYTSDWEWNNHQLELATKDTRVVLNTSKHDRDYNKSGVVDTYDSKSDTLFTQHTVKKDDYDYTVGLEYNEAEANFETSINSYSSSVNETRYTTGYFFEIDKVHNDSIISLSSRIDSVTDFDYHYSSRIGYANGPYRASYSNGYRLPTLYEMHGVDSYGYSGNPNLEPEDLHSYEIGYKNNWLDTALFYIQEENSITYANSSYTNVADGGTSKGVEVGVNKEVNGFYLQTNTTYTEAKLNNGNEKLRRPRWTNNSSVSKNINDFNYMVSLNYYGNHKDIDSQTWATIDKDDITTIDLILNKEVDNKLFYTGLYNITDENYEQPDGYNQLGFNFKAGIKWKF